MESKANYALIGVFVLVAMASALSFIVWLSNAQFDQKYDQYEVVFQGAVRGLSQGSEVRFNGLRVGEVTALTLDPNDSNAVVADIQINADTPVHTNSKAQLEPLGLTGLNYIQISGGTEEFPLMSELPGKGPFRIPGQMSQIDTLVEGGEDVIIGAQRALGRVNLLLSEDAILNFQGILANIREISGNLTDADLDTDVVNRTLVAFEQAAIDVSAAALAVDEAAQSFDGLVKADLKQALARSEITMAQLDKTLADFSGFAVGAEQLTVDSRDAINRLSNSGLTDVEETLDGVREVVNSLNAVIEELEANPLNFIAGEERETVEIPQ